MLHLAAFCELDKNSFPFIDRKRQEVRNVPESRSLFEHQTSTAGSCSPSLRIDSKTLLSQLMLQLKTFFKSFESIPPACYFLSQRSQKIIYKPLHRRDKDTGAWLSQTLTKLCKGLLTKQCRVKTRLINMFTMSSSAHVFPS